MSEHEIFDKYTDELIRLLDSLHYNSEIDGEVAGLIEQVVMDFRAEYIGSIVKL